MTTATVYSRTLAGLDAPAVTVEVHLSNGLPAFNIVGLPESTVREARERVRSALLNSHFAWPERRITVSLSPADIPKSGGRFDLPIAMGLLLASGQVAWHSREEIEFFGELGLDGSLRPTRGLLSAVCAATRCRRVCAVPQGQVSALSQAPGARLVASPDLLTLCGVLKSSDWPLSKCEHELPDIPASQDMADIQGQSAAKRGLEIAASGGHHLLMVGPPGAGKTLLAAALPGLLPPLANEERLELMMIRDLLGLETRVGRPVRTPHHSITGSALVGGGARALPGEVSLASGGVLFLDELPEFPSRVLDLLRQPLESGEVVINRARSSNRYPARFQLVAAMNPCPCGLADTRPAQCRCTPEVVARYQGRISGPLLDRIDLHLPLTRQDTSSLLEPVASGEPSALIRERVIQCQQMQRQRRGALNAQLPAKALLAACRLAPIERRWLEQAGDRLALSARAIHRVLRVALTLSDMAGEDSVHEDQLMEAMSFRPRI